MCTSGVLIVRVTRRNRLPVQPVIRQMFLPRGNWKFNVYFLRSFRGSSSPFPNDIYIYIYSTTSDIFVPSRGTRNVSGSLISTVCSTAEFYRYFSGLEGQRYLSESGQSFSERVSFLKVCKTMLGGTRWCGSVNQPPRFLLYFAHQRLKKFSHCKTPRLY